MLTQGQDRSHHFGDDSDSEVGFLQAHAACFEQQYCSRFLAVLGILSRQVESRSHLRARHLAHASSLEFPFERDEDGRITSDRAFEDNGTAICLSWETLRRRHRG